MQAGRRNGNRAKPSFKTLIVWPEQLEAIADTPHTQRNTFLKAFAGSKAAAIKAKCLDCSGCERREVTKCTVKRCPLWVVRPFQRGGDA